MRTSRRVTVALLALCAHLTACGGGGGGGTSEPSNPEVALLFVSGHQGLFNGNDSKSYLHEPGEAGPAIVTNLMVAGYSLSVDYFADDGDSVEGYGGFIQLLTAMSYIRDTWAPRGTRTVVVCHSHGGVWAHEAIRKTPGLQVAALVDLDCSSFGWGTTGHDFDNALIDGDPRSAWDIGGLDYDSEDVVFASVDRELEIRSGASVPPFFLEMYDEAWNRRLDGTTSGMTQHFSDTDHTEVHQEGGPTLPLVIEWILARMAE